MKLFRIMWGLVKIGLPEPLVGAIYRGRLAEVDGRAIDPKAQALSDLVALVRDPAVQMTVEQSRKQLAGFVARFDLPGPDVRRTDIKLPGAEGPRAARLYQPESGGKAGTLLYLHGGGWIQGSIDSHDALCAKLAAGADVRVISYDYRLAPEHKYPSASDDILAAYLGLIGGAGKVKADPGKLVVGGDSAGGNLTAALMHDLAEGGHPLPAGQMLIYPAVDGTLSSQSMASLAESPLLPRDRIDWYLDLYLPEGQDMTAPRFSPLYSTRLAGQPPAFVLAAGHDPLWDDGHAYAEALKTAGVPVEMAAYPGQVHGFLNLTRILPQGTEAVERAVTWLRGVLKG